MKTNSNMLRLLALLLVLAQTSLACEDYGGTFRHLTHALYRVITTLWSSNNFFYIIIFGARHYQTNDCVALLQFGA